MHAATTRPRTSTSSLSKEIAMSDNTERLEAAGLIKKTPLPEKYESIVNGLSEREVDTLVGVSTRLRELNDVLAHARSHAPPPDEYFITL
jgi:hypothetical protein